VCAPWSVYHHRLRRRLCHGCERFVGVAVAAQSGRADRAGRADKAGRSRWPCSNHGRHMALSGLRRTKRYIRMGGLDYSRA
jgi:hypothetical protein